jgi:hypothetical protein
VRAWCVCADSDAKTRVLVPWHPAVAATNSLTTDLLPTREVPCVWPAPALAGWYCYLGILPLRNGTNGEGSNFFVVLPLATRTTGNGLVDAEESRSRRRSRQTPSHCPELKPRDGELEKISLERGRPPIAWLVFGV